MDRPIEGWTDGTRWNGWATPRFEFSQAQRLVDEYNRHSPESAWYDPERDRFCFLLDGYEEPDCYEAAAIEVEGESIKVYAIGAWAWVWEESRGEFNDID